MVLFPRNDHVLTTCRRLYEYYGGVVVNLKGPIPANLLGSMWGVRWHGFSQRNNEIEKAFLAKVSCEKVSADYTLNF